MVTAAAFPNPEGLPEVPSLSTLRLLLDLLATYSVPVDESATWATGFEPVGAATTPLTLQPSEALVSGGHEERLPVDRGRLEEGVLRVLERLSDVGLAPVRPAPLTTLAVSSLTILLMTS